MKPEHKAAHLLSEAVYAIEDQDSIQITLDRITDIILELKTLKESEIKSRIQYWQQVKDHIPIKK